VSSLVMLAELNLITVSSPSVMELSAERTTSRSRTLGVPAGDNKVMSLLAELAVPVFAVSTAMLPTQLYKRSFY